MSEAIHMSGIVLSAMPIGDNDKRLVILTREEGKITAFARGARRPKSSLIAAANPFATGTFSLIAGRDAYSLISFSAQNYFTELTERLPGIYYGFYFLELASYYGQEGLDATDSLNLLYLSLLALLNDALDDALVRIIYELRLFSQNGDYAPGEDGLSASADYTCRYICTAPLKKLFSFTVTDEVLKELTRHLAKQRARILDRPIRSMQILEQFIKSAPKE